MNITLIRTIDYYLGIPLCFLLTMVQKILRRKPLPSANEARKILLMDLSEMGSTIIAYSAIKDLHERLPQAELFFLTFHPNKECVTLLNIIPEDNILTIRISNAFHFLIDTVKIIRKLAALKIDIAFDLELFSRYSAILTYLSGAKTRVGFYRFHEEGLYRGGLLSHKVYYNTHVHMVHNFCALMRSVFANNTDRPHLKQNKDTAAIHLPRFEFDPNLLSQYRHRHQNDNKTLVVSTYPGRFLPIRHWGIEHFTNVIRQAVIRLHFNVFLVGTNEASGEAAHILDQLNHHPDIIDLTGKTPTIAELIHVIEAGDVFLTNDSGPAHFASLTHTPTVTLFGPETPALYGPLSANSHPLYSHFLCSPCLTARNHRNTPCRDNKCLQAITPETVLQTIASLL